MKLTPLDIQQHQFARSFRGWDRREVQGFLELVAEHMGALTRETSELQADLRRSHRSLEEYRDREATFKEAMLTAQRAIDEMRDQARKEAQLIVSEAEVRAEKILHAAHARANRVLEDIQELKMQRMRARTELAQVIETHAKLLALHDEQAEPDSDSTTSVTVLNRLRAPSPPREEELISERSS